MRFEEILVIGTVISGVFYAYGHWYDKKHKDKAKKKRTWLVNELIAIFPILLLILGLRSFLFEPFRIPSGSMKPTLLEGDFILVNKFAYGLRLPITGTQLMAVSKPKTGDIIVFRHADGKDLIKRVIGVPGDRVRYKNNQLFINGKAVVQKVLDMTQDHGVSAIESREFLANIDHLIYEYPRRGDGGYKYTDVIVPPNSYFVMGDNRGNSADSRVWGFVAEKDLLGKAVATWMSWDSYSSDKLVPIRWSRIGKSVYKYTDEQ